MIATVALLCSLSAGVSAPAPELERVLIVDTDLRSAPGERDFARTLPTNIARLMPVYSRVQALTHEDVRLMLNLEGQRQESGCDTSCLTDIAVAFGARYVFTSVVGRDSSGVRLAVGLLDMRTAAVVGRAEVHGAAVSELSAQLPFAVDAAMASLRQKSDAPIASILVQQDRLAVLPVDGQTPAQTEAVSRAATAAAARLAMSLLPVDDVKRIGGAAGCTETRCLQAAVAAKGARLALLVNVVEDVDGTKNVRALMMRADGRVAGEGARQLPPLASAVDEARAMMTAVDDATTAVLVPRTAQEGQKPATKKPSTRTLDPPRSRARPPMPKDAEARLWIPAGSVTWPTPPPSRHVAGDAEDGSDDDDDDEASESGPVPVVVDDITAPNAPRPPKPAACKVESSRRNRNGLCSVVDRHFIFRPMSSSRTDGEGRIAGV